MGSKNQKTEIKVLKYASVLALAAVLYGCVTVVFGMISPEFPPDIDFEPFFIPQTLTILLPTSPVALGSALGELVIDDVIAGDLDLSDLGGFIGRLVGFFVTGYLVISSVSTKRVFIACVIGSLCYAIIDASIWFLLAFRTEEIAEAAAHFYGNIGLMLIVQIIGVTITSGIICGALPTIGCIKALRGKLEPILGFPLKEKDKE